MLRWFVRRWSVEVTFAEVRRHLGVETQRQWSDLAIARTTPALLGLFSLVTLWAGARCGGVRARSAAWYPKPRPTFSDALAAVRYRLDLDDFHHLTEPRGGHRNPPRDAGASRPGRLLPGLNGQIRAETSALYVEAVGPK